MNFKLTLKVNSRNPTIHGNLSAVIYYILRLPEHQPGLYADSAP